MKNNRGKGFTLVEMLITVALFAIIMLATTQLYSVYGRMITLQTSSLGASLSASAIANAAHRNGLEARHIASTHLFSGVTYTSGTTTIIFELPALDAAGIPIANIYDYVGVYASSTSVYQVIDIAPESSRMIVAKQLTNVLDTLHFTYDTPDFASVTSFIVDATTTATVSGEIIHTHVREHIYLRNL